MKLTKILLMPHTLPRPPKPRKYVRLWNNKWQEGRYLEVENLGYVEACNERGIKVDSIEDVLSSHLPESPNIEFDSSRNPNIKPYSNEKEHPYYHERPAYSYLARSYYPKYRQLDHAKALFKTVEVEHGLPGRLYNSVTKKVCSNQDDLMLGIIKDTHLFDATQKKLPKTPAVPYIGWHPVEDRMTTRMPYDVTKMSWGRKTRNTYGIPMDRKIMNLTRGMLRCVDSSKSAEHPSLLNRIHLENNEIRQFLERGDKLIRFYLPLAQILTDAKPLKPYANKDSVKSTEDIDLPDIYPMHPLVTLWPTNVYNDQSNFPLKIRVTSETSLPKHNVHTCLDHTKNEVAQQLRTPETVHARALTLGFLSALAQARLVYGSDIKGDLPEPVAVNFIHTDGCNFHFSAYQLNTLNLEDSNGIKNIFWHEEDMSRLFDVCDYVKAVPVLSGYNPEVFSKFAAMYLQNIE